MEIVFAPNVNDEHVFLNNIKVAVQTNDYILASLAVSNWMDLFPTLTLKDIEVELRRQNIPLWLHAKPIPDASFFVSRSFTATPDAHYKYMCNFTVNKPDDMPAETNLNDLCLAGFLSKSSRAMEWKDKTQDAYLVSHGKVKLSMINLEDELQKHVEKYTDDQLEMKVVGMTHEGGPILIPFVNSVPVSNIGTAIEYDKKGEKIVYFVRMKIQSK